MNKLDANVLLYISKFVYASPDVRHLQDLVCMSVVNAYVHSVVSKRVEHVRPKCDFKIDKKLCCGKVDIKRGLKFPRCDMHYMKCNFLIRKRKNGHTIKKYCTASCRYDYCYTHNYIVERKQRYRNHEQTRQYYRKLERERKTKVLFVFRMEGHQSIYMSKLNGDIHDIVDDPNDQAYLYMASRAIFDDN